MATFKSKVPDIGVNVRLSQVQIIPAVESITVSGSRLEARISDGLSEEDHERVSKEIRLLYSFSFEHVYSEDYDINTQQTGYGYSGHDERKEHLLAENSPVSDVFGSTCKQLLEDIANVSLNQTKRRAFFNSAFIWSRANELQELQLQSEAYTQYWRILDMVNAKSQLTQVEIAKLITQYGIEQTQSNIFAVRILHTMGMLREGGDSGNIESLSKLDGLRHPHAHQASNRTEYYMEDETHLETWMNNIFISDITRLFVIWELGLQDYYLKPRANIYELAKRTS
jgi:hypothetical protein